jgi:hypothetical protein
MNGELGLNTIDSVGGVDVLDQSDLEASGRTLARDNGGGGKEVLPDAEPSLAVLGLDLLTVGEPVTVPPPESSGVVNTDGVNVLDLKTGALELVDNPSKRSGSVSTREDVLVHEKTPSQVLVLPSLTETSVLEEENTIVVKHVMNLLQEAGEMADTNVLRHLKTGDLLVTTDGNGNITVIHAENLTLLLGNTGLAHTAVTPSGLVTAESDTSNVGAILLTGEAGKSTPATANVEHGIALVETDLLTDHSKLVVLELLKSLLAVDVGDDTRSVDHTRTKEPAVEVITTVVVVTDLLLILRTSVHDNLGNHAKEEELDESNGETEAGPVMTVLHGLEAVTLEVDIAVKVHLVEGLHGDLVVATVLDTVGLLLEVEVELDTTVRKADLVVLARADGRDNKPPNGEHRKIDDEGEEDGGLEATTKLPAEPPRDQSQEGDENIVVEGIGTRPIGGKGSVLDGRVPGSRNTNILKLIKVRLGKGGSFHKLEVEAGDP